VEKYAVQPEIHWTYREKEKGVNPVLILAGLVAVLAPWTLLVWLVSRVGRAELYERRGVRVARGGRAATAARAGFNPMPPQTNPSRALDSPLLKRMLTHAFAAPVPFPQAKALQLSVPAPKGFTAAFVASVVAVEALIVTYWVGLKLIPTLPVFGVLLVVTAWTGRRALGEVRQRRLAAEKVAAGKTE